MRTYLTELDNVATYQLFALGEEVVVKGGHKGIITRLHMPMNGLYLSPEQAMATVWFGTDEAVEIPDISGRWVSREFSLQELYKNEMS